MDVQECELCHFDFSYTLERCPHCAHPGNYSNVRLTSAADERAAVLKRYDAARRAASSNGRLAFLDDFEKHVATAKAVAARDLGVIERLAQNDHAGYATFYDLTEAGMLLPDGNTWDSLREPADDMLFKGYRKKIRFAALSLNGHGVANYGAFSLAFKTNMIAHRASIWEENSVKFVKRHRLDRAHAKLTGHRAPWDDRSKLVVAKLASQIVPGMGATEYADVLMENGATTDDDRFVEVNIWGPMTVRTIEKVTCSRARIKDPGKVARLRTLRHNLNKFGVALEVEP